MSLGYDPEMPGVSAPPTFPPLLSGVEVARGTDPFVKAAMDAGLGRAETGALYWSPDLPVMRVAVVLSPEETLAEARPILFAAACAINDCLGALAPPEVGVQHVWPGGIKINGANCGMLRLEAAQCAEDQVPDWLIVGLSLSREFGPGDPGASPDITALSEEGCGHISLSRLIESWSRHLLVWINRWEDGERSAIYNAWLARAEGWQSEIVARHAGKLARGTFLGLDDQGGMLLKGEDGTQALSLLDALGAQPTRWPPEEIGA